MQTFFDFFFQMEIESAGGVIIKKNKKDVTHCGFGNSFFVESRSSGYIVTGKFS